MSRFMRLSLLLAGLALAGFGVTASTQLQRRSEPELAATGQTARPQLPAVLVDTALRLPTGRTVVVGAGGDLQAALDTARPGDTIALEPGAVYRGPFRLSARAGADVIVVTSNAPPGTLPPEGTRIDPEFSAWMPILESAGTRPILVIPAGVSGYRFLGLEFRPQAGFFVSDLVTINAAPDLPTTGSLIFDRCYLHGDPAAGSRRGIAMNGGATAVINSYLADFKEGTNDSQALAGWGGPGPFAILNNYLEGAGENVLFGGADPTTAGLVPSDIEIRHNHFAKPLSWKADDPSYAGRRWAVKNLLELKNARRVIIDGNIFEHAWRAAQSGFAILFTVRNQDGRAAWSTVEDVTFTNNIVRRATSGINILGQDDIRVSQVTRRILVGNNLFEDIGGVWGWGRLFQVLNGAEDVTFEHNTAAALTDSFLMGGDTRPHARLAFTDNIVPHNLYGVFGSATAVGLASIDRYFPGARFERNVIIGGSPARYPPDQFFPATPEDVGFADLPGGNYRLGAGSAFLATAADGTASGVDFARLDAATAGADQPAARIAPPQEVMPDMLPVVPPPSTDDLTNLAALAWPVLLVSGSLLVWTYAGYPVFVFLWSRFRPRSIRRMRIEPSVSVLVIAHNEEAAIAGRVRNLLDLDYPAERLDIVIASDGSTDATIATTQAAVRTAGTSRVRVVAFTGRRGKAGVLNDVVPQLTGEIVVLADTRQRIDTAAIRALVEPFADAGVGAVSGELMLDATDSGALGGVGGYWRYEKLIRRSESAVDSSIGATGALYAIRRSLFEPIPGDTLLDDALIPLRITRRGYRVVFEPRARAFDRVSASAGGEFARKVRTSAGNVQLLARETWLLNPARNRLWLQTLSHKGLRLALPFLHAATLTSSLMLAAVSPPAMALVVAQAAFLLLGLAGAAGRMTPPWLRALAAAPYAICLLNGATVAGLARFARGGQPVTWERTPVSRLRTP